MAYDNESHSVLADYFKKPQSIHFGSQETNQHPMHHSSNDTDRLDDADENASESHEFQELSTNHR